MKKLIAALLILATVFALASCGGNKPAEDSKPADTSSVPPVSTDTAGTAEPADTEFVNDGSYAIYDDNCVVRVTGTEYDALWGLTVGLYCENRTENSEIRVQVNKGSVNGVEVDTVFSCDVAPGKNKTDSISLTLPDEMSDVESYTDIELCFEVYDLSSASSEPIAVTSFNVYPEGKENAEVFKREPQRKDIEVITPDENDLSVTIIGFGRDSLYECMVKLYIVNDTDRALVFTADDVKLNGKPCDPMFAVTVRAHKSAFTTVGWLHSTLYDQRLTSVSTIAMTINASDVNDPENVLASGRTTVDAPDGLGAK